MQPIEVSRIVMRDVLALERGEEVLIVTNPGEVLGISLSLFEAAREMGGKPTVLVQEAKGTLDYAERAVLEALKSEPDVVISISQKKLGKDPHGLHVGYVGRDGRKYAHIFEKLLHGDRRIRAFWSPGIDTYTYLRAVPIDYGRLRDEAKVLAEILDRGREVHITSDAGTDLWMSIEGRKALKDDGDFRKPGRGGNIPAGEVFISPAVGRSEGTIVFDGTIGLGGESVVPKTPVKVKVKGGFVVSIEGGTEAGRLEEAIKSAERRALEMDKKELARNSWHLGELGIGLNPRAKMSGKLLEDEKLRNTVHIAIGANYDNDAPALNHFDCLIMNPTVEVDGERIMEKGRFLIF
ncbi:aminopeptidase [Palaeococcus ferrophilus]|uniref:aminopeptidase n=1 Tax=Palaeococcus ferrophilus TaxID=83868 RepID=UPI00064EBC19|nr:aminopeptidase [Palaeococcus ferrophilus]